MSQQAQLAVQTQRKATDISSIKGSMLQRAAINTTITPVHSGILQRCSAGVECAACRQKRLEKEGTLQRAAVNSAPANGIPPIVHDVLNSSGQPLDAGTRAFMEPRFGHDFSQVRVHTDDRAAESAQAVNALAYTVGRDLVFGTGQYVPGTVDGRRLLAHELTHVVQQGGSVGVLEKLSHPSDPLEKAADGTADMVINGGNVATDERIAQVKLSAPTIFRKVVPRLMNCPAGVNGAPADPVAVLTDADSKAESLAREVSGLLNLDSIFTSVGFRNLTPKTQSAYQRRFGLPPARPGGFLNRLTGVVRPTQDMAISEELGLLSKRFELIARTFNQILHYRCIGGISTFAGCDIPDCDAGAWSCPGKDVIFLCPLFWGQHAQERAAILIHEAGHIYWGRVRDDVTLAGPGRNFRIAECYASFVADVEEFITQVEPCPVPPP